MNTGGIPGRVSKAAPWQVSKRSISGRKERTDSVSISSPLKKSEICDETEMATPKPKRRKREEKVLWESTKQVLYVLVDKENIENTPKNFRSDVDVVLRDASKKEQK